LIHLSCFESNLKPRSSYNDDFFFGSVPCVDAGPLILLSELKQIAGKLNKYQLKAYLRSKEKHVVDENCKDIPKSDLIDTLVVFSNMTNNGNKEYRRLKYNKTLNCDYRLLNDLFELSYSNKQAH
jgi:hypothetical protein